MIYEFFRKRSLLKELDEVSPLFLLLSLLHDSPPPLFLQRQTFELSLSDFQSLEPQLTQRISIASAKVQNSYFSRSAIIIDSDDEEEEEEEQEEEGEGEIEEEGKETGEAAAGAGNGVVDVSNIMAGAADYGAEEVGRTYFRKKSMD
jgi:hypothetical protein